MTQGSATVVTSDDTDLVAVSGDLDIASRPAVYEAVITMLTARTARWTSDAPFAPVAVLDLSAVSFAASSGLSLLLELDARAAAKKVPLAMVVAPDSSLARVLERTGLSMVLTTSPTVEQARRIAPPPPRW